MAGSNVPLQRINQILLIVRGRDFLAFPAEDPAIHPAPNTTSIHLSVFLLLQVPSSEICADGYCISPRLTARN